MNDAAEQPEQTNADIAGEMKSEKFDYVIMDGLIYYKGSPQKP